MGGAGPHILLHLLHRSERVHVHHGRLTTTSATPAPATNATAVHRATPGRGEGATAASAAASATTGVAQRSPSHGLRHHGFHLLVAVHGVRTVAIRTKRRFPEPVLDRPRCGSTTCGPIPSSRICAATPAPHGRSGSWRYLGRWVQADVAGLERTLVPGERRGIVHAAVAEWQAQRVRATGRASWRAVMAMWAATSVICIKRRHAPTRGGCVGWVARRISHRMPSARCADGAVVSFSPSRARPCHDAGVFWRSRCSSSNRYTATGCPARDAVPVPSAVFQGINLGLLPRSEGAVSWNSTASARGAGGRTSCCG